MEKIHPTPPTPPKYSSPSSNAIALSVVAFNNNSIPPWSPHTTTNQSTPLFGEEPRGPMPNMHSRATKTSIYRGVTRHKWTGRYEAHLWDKNCWDEKRNKKGRQVYLGAYKIEEDAARAYDIASLKYWGVNAITNFPVQTYAKEYMQMQMLSKNQLLANIRRRSSGFARGASRYRGVTRHHQNGRWEARISRVNGNKYLYLGTFDTEEQAAQAYDLACIEYRGARAITNFDANLYIRSPQVAPVQPFPHRIAQESIQPLSVPQLPQQRHHLSPTNLAPLATTNAQVQAADVPVLDVNMFEDVFDDLTWDLSTEITFDQCDADANVVAASADEIDSMLQELLHNDLFNESNGSFLLEPELKNASGPTSVSVMDQDGCNVQNMANEGPSSATSSSGTVN